MTSNSAITLPDYSVTHPNGQPNGTTVVLLHGAFGAKDYWRDQAKALVQAGYRVVAWDAPGYGLSPLPSDFSIDLCAKALCALLEEVGGERNVVVGHSMGGMIAQRAWFHARSMIHGYVLSATSAAFGHPDGDWQKEFVRQRVAPLDAGRSIADYTPEMLRTMMKPGAGGEGVELVIATVQRMREETFRAAIAAIAGFDGRALLASIDVPVLCLAGEHDATAPAAVMQKMAQKIAGAEFQVMADVGHFGWAERSEDFNALLLDFLARRGFDTAGA
ncbi:MAG: alpha/beta hydrolase [Polaromonas sp.]